MKSTLRDLLKALGLGKQLGVAVITHPMTAMFFSGMAFDKATMCWLLECQRRRQAEKISTD